MEVNYLVLKEDIATKLKLTFKELALINSKLNITNLQQKTLNMQADLNKDNAWQQTNFLELQKIYKFNTTIINTYLNLLAQANYLQELLEILADNEINLETKNAVDNLHQKTLDFKVTSFFNNNDKNDCYLEILCGSGGLDAQDFTNMLLNMYVKYCGKNNFKCTLIDASYTDSGIKNATLEVQGINAYGFLKNEQGVHRLIRVSPFNAEGKRQTSFAAVNVYAKTTVASQVTLKPEDIKIDTFRAKGAGGQHVNTTESAVRITYLPLGLAVAVQNHRSQHQNKALALELLQAKINNYYKQQQKNTNASNYNNKVDIDFGNQIRSYILHPYLMVKDHRIGFSASNVNNILQGDLSNLIMLLLSNNN